MTKRRKLTEEDISYLLDESEDEYKETDSGIPDTNDDGEIDCISKSQIMSLQMIISYMNFLQTSE